ncbi:hypothetical protein ACLB2K_060747 [Fragaria x ananassa]
MSLVIMCRVAEEAETIGAAVKLSGHQVFTFNFDSPTRSVEFSVGDRLAVITTDPFMEQTSAIHVKRIAADPADQTAESILTLKITPQGRMKINRAMWGPLNRTIMSAGEDAVIRIWDSEVIISFVIESSNAWIETVAYFRLSFTYSCFGFADWKATSREPEGGWSHKNNYFASKVS